eukprot:5777835-Lingulodinium_polyedra.AAC.1
MITVSFPLSFFSCSRPLPAVALSLLRPSALSLSSFAAALTSCARGISNGPTGLYPSARVPHNCAFMRNSVQHLAWS